MNRIILIGNGFDLAHGLPTKYTDFMNDYWKEFAQKYPKTEGSSRYEDQFIEFENTNGPKGGNEVMHSAIFMGETKGKAFFSFLGEIVNITSYHGLKRLIAKAEDDSGLIYKLSFKNKFWGHICETSCLKTWLDIENEYYTLLKDFLLENRRYADLWPTVNDLNKEFGAVKDMLEKYLTKACEKGVKPIESIIKIVESPFRLEDIALSKQDVFLNNIAFEYFRDMTEDEWKEHYDNNQGHYDNPYVKGDEEGNRDFLRDEIKNNRLDEYFLKHNKTLLLNFNYTNNAEKMYAISEGRAKHNVIHIHGELNNPDNPMVFGYGDELDDDYRKIENTNNPDMLDNIKSVAYGNKDNYSRLLRFLQLEHYQVFIMGHSCGNSDRTLLNEIFENPNCMSVKLFYHKESDGTDNFSNVYKNISRNFNNKRALRDIVVNKTFCEPMPQNETTEKHE